MSEIIDARGYVSQTIGNVHRHYAEILARCAEIARSDVSRRELAQGMEESAKLALEASKAFCKLAGNGDRKDDT